MCSESLLASRTPPTRVYNYSGCVYCGEGTARAVFIFATELFVFGGQVRGGDGVHRRVNASIFGPCFMAYIIAFVPVDEISVGSRLVTLRARRRCRHHLSRP